MVQDADFKISFSSQISKYLQSPISPQSLSIRKLYKWLINLITKFMISKYLNSVHSPINSATSCCFETSAMKSLNASIVFQSTILDKVR